MSANEPQHQTEPEEPKPDCGCSPAPEGCDTDVIDELTCRATGVAAQAAYDATYQADLEQAKTDYDTVRRAYQAQRRAASVTVQDLRHQVHKLIDKIRCLIKKRVWKCLDEAFCVVVKQLDACGPPPGCCVTACDFATDGAGDLSISELLAKIADYQRRTDEAKACFTLLKGEPDALTARVDAVQAKIDEINAALLPGATEEDLKRVYAMALVAERDLGLIWGGFAQTQDFVECLCQALTCWTQGCAAVSVLTGIKAVKECKQKAVDDRCATLATQTVEEILAVYDRLCVPADDEPQEPKPKPKDCGCGGHDDDHDHATTTTMTMTMTMTMIMTTTATMTIAITTTAIMTAAVVTTVTITGNRAATAAATRSRRAPNSRRSCRSRSYPATRCRAAPADRWSARG